MDIPAYTSPTLCLGRTFDLETSRACADVFPSSSDLPIKSMNFNKFSFKYQVVKSSKDVNDLLDVSGELSLKIKANLLRVEGAGQYINESKLEEGTTSLLAVMKCTTVRMFAEESQKAAFVNQIKHKKADVKFWNTVERPLTRTSEGNEVDVEFQLSC